MEWSDRASQMNPSANLNAPMHRRLLRTADALAYLDSVKAQFRDRQEVYDDFINTMKAFTNNHLGTLGVIERVAQLFSAHPKLIHGFNTFLPEGYDMICSTDPSAAGYITVMMPDGQMMKGTAYTTARGGQALSWTIVPAHVTVKVVSAAQAVKNVHIVTRLVKQTMSLAS